MKPQIGDLIKLRDDVLQKVKPREWTFLARAPNNLILITYATKGPLFKCVMESDIDWGAYEKKYANPPIV